MKKRNMLIGAAAIATLLLLGGCASAKDRLTGNYLNSKKNQKAAIKQLEKQFDTEFTYLEDKQFPVGSGNVFGGHTGITVYMYVECDKLPGKKITVSASDNGTVSSDYIVKLYEDETSEKIKQIAGEAYDGEIGVFFEDDLVTPQFDADTTLEDYLASPCLHFLSICITDNEQHEEKFTKFVDLLRENGINCIPSVYIYDSNVYSSGEEDIFKMDNEHGIGVSRYKGLQYILDEDFELDYEFYEYFVNTKGY